MTLISKITEQRKIEEHIVKTINEAAAGTGIYQFDDLRKESFDFSKQNSGSEILAVFLKKMFHISFRDNTLYLNSKDFTIVALHKLLKHHSEIIQFKSSLTLFLSNISKTGMTIMVDDLDHLFETFNSYISIYDSTRLRFPNAVFNLSEQRIYFPEYNYMYLEFIFNPKTTSNKLEYHKEEGVVLLTDYQTLNSTDHQELLSNVEGLFLTQMLSTEQNMIDDKARELLGTYNSKGSEWVTERRLDYFFFCIGKTFLGEDAKRVFAASNISRTYITYDHCDFVDIMKYNNVYYFYNQSKGEIEVSSDEIDLLKHLEQNVLERYPYY